MAEKKSQGSGTGTGKKTSGSRKSSASKKGSGTKSGASTRSSSRTARAPRAEAARKRSGREIADAAAEQLAGLTSKQVEAVTGLQRTEDGWEVEVEVLELRRVPNTTDVLASYRVEVDGDGELVGYRRRHRYVRGTPGEEGS